MRPHVPSIIPIPLIPLIRHPHILLSSGGRQNHEYHWSSLENDAKNAVFAPTLEYHGTTPKKAVFPVEEGTRRVRKTMSICGEVYIFTPKTPLFTPTVSTCGEYLWTRPFRFRISDFLWI